MTIDRRWVLGGGLAMTAGCGPAPVAMTERSSGARPRRVVSLNPCLDVILVEVADRDQIAALSHYSRDAYGSTIAEIAATLPTTYGTAEEVIALSPDQVLTGRFSSAGLRNAVDRLGIATTVFDVPETVQASLDQVHAVAGLVGHPQRGEAMVRRIEAALAMAAPLPGSRPLSALVFMPGGFVSGPGTLMDEMMRRTGLENAAGRYGLAQSMTLPLEKVVADPPDLLLSGEPTAGAPSRAERVMRHPALTQVADRMRRAILPERLLFCGGPVLIRTAAILARARDAALAARA